RGSARTPRRPQTARHLHTLAPKLNRVTKRTKFYPGIARVLAVKIPIMAKAASYVLCSLFLLGLGCAGNPQAKDPDQTSDSTTSGDSSNGGDTSSNDVKSGVPDKTVPVEKDHSSTSDKPVASEPQEAPPKPMISCEPPPGAKAPSQKLAMTIDRAQVNLDDHRLEVKLNQPACKVELKVVGESGRTIA
ncbi:MAG TPA: hypothetical protein DCE44_19415, partial [Verrucomicrobiales bacterium]|nr:hypothetical protein [Verrucomicrobiales bacterium]